MTGAALLHPFIPGLIAAVIVAFGWHSALFGLEREQSQFVVAGVFSYVVYYCVLMVVAFVLERFVGPFRWTKVALICSFIALLIPVLPYALYAFPSQRRGSGSLGWDNAGTFSALASLPGIFVTEAIEAEFRTGR